MALSPGADRPRAGGRGGRGAAAPVGCQLAAPAVLRVAVLPLPEAEPRRGRPCRIVERDAGTADGRAPRTGGRQRCRQLRAARPPGVPPAAGGPPAPVA